ncbi:MAG TPA: bifunctional phosphopantothenoylcysteine decarboxylase/phosphopantothenate--cysteine ligase CoaBC [Polyangiaceae bacterium]|nr:bifunctional phosphopantothenoylcysteine decarboxylase/phosphopantothenate--cysteine ligase CoaBC [Polyangiaceae bacterium]
MTATPALAGKKITLCVAGSIAAYKAVLLARRLLAEGAELEVALTNAAREFIGPATFSGLTGRPVLGEMFAPDRGGEPHVALGKSSDLVLVVPATADALARFAQGRADDFTSALVLCASCPVLAAPAMHPSMWEHPATARNVAELAADGRVRLVGPVAGPVASGDIGMGRMAEPNTIFDAVLRTLTEGQTLKGVRVLVTAGPTAEDIDPVRYVGNRSSGKMGFAIAARAAELGAAVTLIAGPVSLATPAGVTRIDVRTAASLKSALWSVLGSDLRGTDVLVMAAAVADYRPAHPSETKLRRLDQPITLELVPNPDLLAEVGRARQGSEPLLVGFALGTEDDARAVATARQKLVSKRVDFVVSNHADESIGRDDIRAILVGANDEQPVELGPKRVLADRILARVAAELAARRG